MKRGVGNYGQESKREVLSPLFSFPSLPTLVLLTCYQPSLAPSCSFPVSQSPLPLRKKLEKPLWRRRRAIRVMPTNKKEKCTAKLTLTYLTYLFHIFLNMASFISLQIWTKLSSWRKHACQIQLWSCKKKIIFYLNRFNFRINFRLSIDNQVRNFPRKHISSSTNVKLSRKTQTHLSRSLVNGETKSNIKKNLETFAQSRLFKKPKELTIPFLKFVNLGLNVTILRHW